MQSAFSCNTHAWQHLLRTTNMIISRHTIQAHSDNLCGHPWPTSVLLFQNLQACVRLLQRQPGLLRLLHRLSHCHTGQKQSLARVWVSGSFNRSLFPSFPCLAQLLGVITRHGGRQLFRGSGAGTLHLACQRKDGARSNAKGKTYF